MHTIDLSKISLRTDLIIENTNQNNYQTTTKEINNIKIETTISSNQLERYTTISFNDISDKDNHKNVEKIFIDELKKYVEKLHLKSEDEVLIVGLGNSNSTPDSLGPQTIKQILVTRYLFKLGEVEAGYQNVAAISPEVTATTGIETSELIRSLSKNIKTKLIIVVDALAASSLARVNKTIQITNTGIHPGSGVGNNRKEISEKTLGIPVIAIGVPTVVDAATIVSDTFKYMQKQFSFKLNNYHNNALKLIPITNQDYSKEEKKLNEATKKEILGEVGILTDSEFKQLVYEVLYPINSNLMVTPTEIDFVIERVALLIGNGINKTLHQHYNPTNNK